MQPVMKIAEQSKVILVVNNYTTAFVMERKMKHWNHDGDLNPFLYMNSQP